ncbi:MAG: hypothetical protein OXF72_02565 [Gammaproteobacteria bacterium]|nr:hypothetical protein [Gammaproteobacteria bacterium]MCY4199394.1 hypothetical protein [Gammaproteobacteria bacterium]MCY4278792.1 hypothetical protein [Gammaproteobacteria bacterium]MCY4323039.1 hypothetical protein [Gammaproteobacteria bacterium]
MIARFLGWMLVGLASLGSLAADPAGVREHPFKALDGEMPVAADAHADIVLVGVLETPEGFHALIKREQGPVTRVRAGERLNDGRLVARVWASGARIDTAQGIIELTLR